jgi:hypothetical protein
MTAIRRLNEGHWGQRTQHEDPLVSYCCINDRHTVTYIHTLNPVPLSSPRICMVLGVLKPNTAILLARLPKRTELQL